MWMNFATSGLVNKHYIFIAYNYVLTSRFKLTIWMNFAKAITCVSPSNLYNPHAFVFVFASTLRCSMYPPKLLKRLSRAFFMWGIHLVAAARWGRVPLIDNF